MAAFPKKFTIRGLMAVRVTPKSLSYLKDKYIMYVFYEVYNILCMYGELNKNSLELNTILTSEQHLYFQVQFRTTLTYHHLQLDIINLMTTLTCELRV